MLFYFWKQAEDTHPGGGEVQISPDDEACSSQSSTFSDGVDQVFLQQDTQRYRRRTLWSVCFTDTQVKSYNTHLLYHQAQSAKKVIREAQ